MRKTTHRKVTRATPALMIGAVILAASSGAGAAQTAAAATAGQTAGAAARQAAGQAAGTTANKSFTQAQKAYRLLPEAPTPAYVIPQVAVSVGPEGTQVPQDIRIMQRIVRTALEEVEAPELPEALRADGEPSRGRSTRAVSVGGSDATLFFAGPGTRAFSIGGREVTGFYMQGYGYLFNVTWRVASGDSPFLASGATVVRRAELAALAGEARRAAAAGEPSEARAAGDAERALEQERERLEERQASWDLWSAQYRDLLAASLRDVVAGYGSTLRRATPEESVTFIADFGGGEEETVTVSARRGQLAGSRDENLAAVQLAKGDQGVSGTLRTELKIMAEIIDSALQVERTDDVWVAYVDYAPHFGGDSSYQYVPGYGVLFHKAARLNLATHVVQQVAPSRVPPGATASSLRQRIDDSTEEQRQAYTEHLADLKQRTAEILATYGPTLTEMNDDGWVGVYYNVGRAAGLLEGGISNFLVQARMADIREAGRDDVEGATWLLDRLVTNEKQD